MEFITRQNAISDNAQEYMRSILNRMKEREQGYLTDKEYHDDTRTYYRQVINTSDALQFEDGTVDRWKFLDSLSDNQLEDLAFSCLFASNNNIGLTVKGLGKGYNPIVKLTDNELKSDKAKEDEEWVSTFFGVTVPDGHKYVDYFDSEDYKNDISTILNKFNDAIKEKVILKSDEEILNEMIANMPKSSKHQPHILSQLEIREMNWNMLGLGAPIERDDVGYNKPDFGKAYYIGLLDIVTEFNTEEMYYALTLLDKYKNTQLKDSKERIKDSLEFYKLKLLDKYQTEERFDRAINDAKTGIYHKDSDYSKEYVLVYKTDAEYSKDGKNFKGVLVSFRNYEHSRKFGDLTKSLGVKGRYLTEADGYTGKKAQWGHIIPYTSLKECCEIMGEVGKFGYQPTPQLLEFKEKELPDLIAKAEELDKANKEKYEQSKKSFIVKDTKTQDSYKNYLFEINANEPSLVNDLWNQKGECLSFVNNKSYKDKVVVSVRKEHLKNFYDYCKKEGMDVSSLDYRFAPEEFNEGQIEIIDSDKLNLPFNLKDYQIDGITTLLHYKNKKEPTLEETLSKEGLDLFDKLPEDKKQSIIALDKKFKSIPQIKKLVLDEMGLGKTQEIITTLRSIDESVGFDTKKVIVVPASLRLNWKKEILMNDKNANVNIIQSNELEDLQSKGLSMSLKNGWNIVGHSTASKYLDMFRNQTIEAFVMDEAHLGKAVDNYGKPNSSIARMMVELGKKARVTLLATGTPIPNHNKDVYNLLNTINVFDDEYKFYKFAYDYCGAYHNGHGIVADGSSNGEKLNELIMNNAIRRRTKDVLPDLKQTSNFVAISIPEGNEYFNIEEQLDNTGDEETFLGLVQKGRISLAKAKFEAVKDLTASLLEANESVVIFTESNDAIDRYKKFYGDKACIIKGGMSDSAKQKSVDDFQSGAKPIVLVNKKAGGVGITLTKSHNAIYDTFSWVPSDEAQCNARICRTGQTEFCYNHYIYADNSRIEKYFIEMITEKAGNIDAIVDKDANSMDWVAQIDEDRNSAKIGLMNALKKEFNFDETKQETKNNRIDEIIKSGILKAEGFADKFVKGLTPKQAQVLDKMITRAESIGLKTIDISKQNLELNKVDIGEDGTVKTADILKFIDKKITDAEQSQASNDTSKIDDKVFDFFSSL